MPLDRIPWERVPAAVQDAVAARLGDVTATTAVGGATAEIACTLQAADGRRVFVKGIPEGSDDVADLDMEERVGPHLPACAPRVLWRAYAGGWHLLAFEAVDGVTADYAPDAAHLPLVTAAFVEVGGTRAPDVAIYSAWDRWGYWCDPRDEPLFAGDTLLHTDPAATNVLVGGGRARLVDWSWATRGPAWIDPVLWGTRLVSDGGHTTEQAWARICRLDALGDAPARGIAALAAAEATRWAEHLAEGVPDISPVTRAARDWADFLG